MTAAVPIDRLRASSFTIPTEEPESDATLEWDRTTLVLVEVEAGGEHGLGYSYTHTAAAQLIDALLAGIVLGDDALRVRRPWQAMRRAVRNLGQGGLAGSAIAAVDIALWDLKARLLQQPLPVLLDAPRDRVPAYGSGGFTSYSDRQLERQLGAFAAAGLRWVKMKVGRRPQADLQRVACARAAIGDEVGLFVDANGGLQPQQAAALAERFAEHGVGWFEEPVTSDDLAGLRWLRQRVPPGIDIAAGEYGWCTADFERLLAAEAVDVLQADATRCQGITGFLAAGALCAARGRELSAHTAPTVHAHAACAAGPVRHVEYFHDHARIEQLCFDGALAPHAGDLCPDLGRPGLGLELKRPDVEAWQSWQGRDHRRRAAAAAGNGRGRH